MNVTENYFHIANDVGYIVVSSTFPAGVFPWKKNHGPGLTLYATCL